MRYYPKGFVDADYLDLERGYKWTAHKRWSSDLGKAKFEGLLRAGEFGEIATRAIAIEALTEWTSSGEMRHPVFLGLRVDKRAEDVVREREKPRKK